MWTAQDYCAVLQMARASVCMVVNALFVPPDTS